MQDGLVGVALKCQRGPGYRRGDGLPAAVEIPDADQLANAMLPETVLELKPFRGSSTGDVLDALVARYCEPAAQARSIIKGPQPALSDIKSTADLTDRNPIATGEKIPFDLLRDAHDTDLTFAGD